MLMPAAGDIVTVFGQSGRWAVLGPALSDIPPERRWHCRRESPPRFPEFRTVGDGDLSVITSPAITPGMSLRWWGAPCTVVAVHGDVIRITYQRPRAGSLGGSCLHKVDVSRGELVAENFGKLEQ
jgi:hypothetical protein